MTIDSLLLPFVWVLNGILAVLYTLADHLPVVAIVPALAWLYAMLNRLHEQQARRMQQILIPSGVLALAATIWAPSPAPLLMVGLTAVGALAVRLDAYRPDETAWEVVQNVLLYALVALGARILLLVLENQTPGDALSVGANYLGVLTAFALWGMPILQSALLLKNLLAHAPVGASPLNYIEEARGRKR